MFTLIPLRPPPDLRVRVGVRVRLGVRGLRELRAHLAFPESPASLAPPVVVLGHLVIRGIKAILVMPVIPVH